MAKAPYRGKRGAVVPLSRKQEEVLARDFGRRVVTRDAQAVMMVEQRAKRAEAIGVAAVSGEVDVLQGQVGGVTAVSGQLGGVTILSGELTHDPGSIAAQTPYGFNITVAGAETGNTPCVVATTGYDLASAGITIMAARVSEADTVRVLYWNENASSAVNLPSHTVRAVVFQY